MGMQDASIISVQIFIQISGEEEGKHELRGSWLYVNPSFV